MLKIKITSLYVTASNRDKMKEENAQLKEYITKLKYKTKNLKGERRLLTTKSEL